MARIRGYCGLLLIGLALTLQAQEPEQNRSLRTKQFVVMGYSGLAYELRTSEGPYCQTLVDLLAVATDARPAMLKQVRELVSKTPNIMDLADQIAMLAPAGAGEALPPPAIELPTGPSVYAGDKLENALEHLTRGMQVTVYLKNGEIFQAKFEEYASRRLWVRGGGKRSFHIRDIVAIDAPKL